MIALHISIIQGKIFLWSEDHTVGNLKSLRTAVKAIHPDFSVPKSLKAFVWLPSYGNIPLPSLPMFERPIDKRKKLKLMSHPVFAIPLSSEETLALAGIVRKGTVPGSGIVFGESMNWLSHACRLVLNIIAKENFIPGLTEFEGSWQARWFPVPDNHEEQQLEKLVKSMPNVCRCLSFFSDESPETPSRIITQQLLATLVDEIVRHAIDQQEHKDAPACLHDAWLNALYSVDGSIQWPDVKDLRAFAKQLKDWSRPVELYARSPFRFCFRLAEPDDNKMSWKVDYLLQPKSDQSTLLPVKELWNKNSKKADYFEKTGTNPIEFMLTALGQASGVCPPVSTSLKHKNPSGFELDAAGALKFLTDYAQILKSSGFVVMLPSWWIGRGPAKRLGLKAKTKNSKPSGSGFTLDSMMEFDYIASLGKQELSLAELKELARLKEPLIKIRGQWTQIDQEQIKAAVRFLEKQQTEPMQARDLLEISLGKEKTVAGLSINNVQLDGSLKTLVDSLTGRKKFNRVPQPDKFKGTLRPYQEHGFSWLAFLRQWGLGACLADDMGLGKTVQTLALIQKERQNGETRPVLLICPTSVVNNWRKETERFTPNLEIMIHHGIDRRKQTAFIKTAGKKTIVVSTFALLQRDIEFIAKVNWAGIILDEAQNIKNPTTKQSKAARSLNADYRIALTGTPVENHVGDLWSIMEFLNPGLLGTMTSFQTQFHKPIQLYGDQQAAKKLKTITRPFILRRLKTDKSIIRDLPDKIEIKEYCPLTKEQASLYQAVVDDMQNQIEKVDGMDRRGLVLATLIRLKQVCNHPAQFADDNSSLHGRSGKLERLLEMLLEIKELNEKALIFTQFAAMGSLLQRYFQEYFGETVYFLYGGIPKKKRDEMIERFQSKSKAPYIFILSLKAGGTGLTLTRANHVFHYDRWWNPSVENQATDRAFRIGQKKDVQVHKFIVSGTLEERIDEMIEHKSGIADQVVGTGEKWLSELSNEELYNVIKLDRETIED